MAVDKTSNMEHSGTSCPKHGIIIIIMRKICKIKFSTINETIKNWYQPGKLGKKTTKQNKFKEEEKKKYENVWFAISLIA